MEIHTEIENVLRPAVSWDCTRPNVVIAFRYFWITNQFHLQGSRCPKRTLEELTIIELVWW